MAKPPKTFRTRQYKDPEDAFKAITEIYDAGIAYLREEFTELTQDKLDNNDRPSAFCQYVKITAKLFSPSAPART